MPASMAQDWIDIRSLLFRLVTEQSKPQPSSERLTKLEEILSKRLGSALVAVCKDVGAKELQVSRDLEQG